MIKTFYNYITKSPCHWIIFWLSVLLLIMTFGVAINKNAALECQKQQEFNKLLKQNENISR